MVYNLKKKLFIRFLIVRFINHKFLKTLTQRNAKFQYQWKISLLCNQLINISITTRFVEYLILNFNVNKVNKKKTLI